MRRLLTTLACWLLWSVPAYAQLGTVPYSFSPGTVILSAEVNTNFSTAYSNALNRTGGTMTGTLNTLHVLPIADNTHDLGSASYSFRNVFIDGTLTLATGSFTTLNVSGVTSLNGDVNVGNAATDVATITATIAGGTPLVFEGATADDYELTFAITDPTTIDKVVTFQNVTGTVYVSTGTDVALADGGTNASLSAVQGGVLYSGASALAVSAAGSSGQIFQSAGTGTPVWTTATYPATATGTGTVLRANGTNWVATTSTFADTYTAYNLLYASASNTVGGLATAASGLLVTSAGGVPSIATDIPTAVTIGSAYVYRASGTDVAVADGGTGLSSYAVGDIVHATATGTLAGLADVALGQVLVSGGVGVAPAWDDSVTLSGTHATYATASAALAAGIITTATSNHVLVSSNLYYNGGWKYAGNFYGVHLGVTATGDFEWNTAPVNAGGAGAAATVTERMRLTNGGILFVGDTANTGMSAGLTLQQAGADDEILALKSSDVAHGVTGLAETDTYGAFAKDITGGGGLRIIGLSDEQGIANGHALLLYGVVDNDWADTTRGTTAKGVVHVNTERGNGATTQAMGANDNLFAVANYGSARFLVDAEGDIHMDATSNIDAWDDEDDIALLETFRVTTANPSYNFRLATNLETNRRILSRTGVVTYNADGHHFVSLQNLLGLTIDGMRQLRRDQDNIHARMTNVEDAMVLVNTLQLQVASQQREMAALRTQIAAAGIH